MADLPSGYEISDDQSRIDVAAAHQYLTQSYWAKGITIDLVERSIKESLCFAIFHLGEQIGFARIITDYATMAYLADVYVLEQHRGQGLSKALLSTIHAHPDLQGLRYWLLMTKDAHGLYKQFGWSGLKNPDRAMRIDFRDVYQ